MEVVEENHLSDRGWGFVRKLEEASVEASGSDLRCAQQRQLEVEKQEQRYCYNIDAATQTLDPNP